MWCAALHVVRDRGTHGDRAGGAVLHDQPGPFMLVHHQAWCWLILSGEGTLGMTILKRCSRGLI